MIAALLSFISVLSRSFVRNVPARTTGFAGLVVNVLPHVFLMKNIFALTFPNLPTSATAVSNVPGVLWKNAFTKPITPERIRAAQKRIPVRFRSFRSGTQTTRRCGVSASHKGTVPSPYLCTPYRWAHEIWKNPVCLYKQRTFYCQGSRHATDGTYAAKKKCFQKT